jgi:hypothetical protein
MKRTSNEADHTKLDEADGVAIGLSSRMDKWDSRPPHLRNHGMLELHNLSLLPATSLRISVLCMSEVASSPFVQRSSYPCISTYSAQSFHPTRGYASGHPASPPPVRPLPHIRPKGALLLPRRLQQVPPRLRPISPEPSLRTSPRHGPLRLCRIYRSHQPHREHKRHRVPVHLHRFARAPSAAGELHIWRGGV